MKLFNLITVFSFIIFNLSAAQAKIESIQINENSIFIQNKKGFGIFSQNKFSDIKVQGLQNTQAVGEASLPVKTWILVGKPADITVDVQIQKSQVFKNVIPYPTQEQPCRCLTEKKINFSFNTQSYAARRDSQAPALFNLKYLGAYKGKSISQLSVPLAHFDAASSEVILNTGVTVNYNTTEFSLEKEDLKNYLIIVPQALASGLDDFISWKKSQGYNLVVEKLASPNTTTQAVATLVKNYYDRKQADFVIIIGDDKMVPMFEVKTESSPKTPSDLKYFLMDGAKDLIPDVYSSRIVASDADQVKMKLAKVIEFEMRSYVDNKGLNTIVGIASNEGEAPSDNDYVQNIEKQFQSRMSFKVVHFYQNDKKSNPTELNLALSSGAVWLTYIGHGSGTSWPSMNQEYNLSSFQKIQNKDAVKPIVIDVACMNGRLSSDYFGSSFTQVYGLASNDGFGAAAYFGGSVNISWNPPALMATGIAIEHSKKNFNHLGQAILAGQLYLAGHWDNADEISDNLKWYHLQGDPGMNIHF